MNMLIWNVRRFNHLLKQKEVVSRIRRLNIKFACLLETRVKQHKMQEIVNKPFAGWSLFHNYSEAYNGRIWMLWNGDTQVDLYAITDQSITCRIQQDHKTFYFSAIYGCNEGLDRRRLWSHLLSLQNSFVGEPWLLSGDFNIIAHPSKSFPKPQGVSSEMREFTDAMIQLSIFDHVYTGLIFTWTNHQPDGFLARKLDRVLINDIWLSRFPHSSVEFLPLRSRIIVQLLYKCNKWLKVIQSHLYSSISGESMLIS